MEGQLFKLNYEHDDAMKGEEVQVLRVAPGYGCDESYDCLVLSRNKRITVAKGGLDEIKP